MQGDLTRETLADAIRTLYVNRRSGILHLSHEKVSKWIYFRKGSIIFANSDVESDRLGEFLIRQNVLDRTSFEKTTDTMKDTGRRFGQTVVEFGYCTADEMQAKVVEQIQTIIFSLFEWKEGSYRVEQHENPVDEDIVLNLSTADIVLEGTRRMEDTDRIRQALGDTSRILEQNENPLLLYQKMSTLSQSEYFILSRVDGMSSIDDIFAVSPLGEDETLKCIYGLISAGVLVLQGESRAAAREEAAAAPVSDLPRVEPPAGTSESGDPPASATTSATRATCRAATGRPTGCECTEAPRNAAASGNPGSGNPGSNTSDKGATDCRRRADCRRGTDARRDCRARGCRSQARLAGRRDSLHSARGEAQRQ